MAKYIIIAGGVISGTGKGVSVLSQQLKLNSSIWKHYSNYDIGFSGNNYDFLIFLIKKYFVAWPCFEYKVRKVKKWLNTL